MHYATLEHTVEQVVHVCSEFIFIDMCRFLFEFSVLKTGLLVQVLAEVEIVVETGLSIDVRPTRICG